MKGIELVPNKKPNMNSGFPSWWHPAGGRLTVKPSDSYCRQLVLTNDTGKAWLRICQHSAPEENLWKISWKVIHRFDSEDTGGIIFFSSKELKTAFALIEGLGVGSGLKENCLLNIYGGDKIVQGKFIRYTENFTVYLNIPCPGTGQDGDPNLSILVTDEIREAVRKLFE